MNDKSIYRKRNRKRRKTKNNFNLIPFLAFIFAFLILRLALKTPDQTFFEFHSFSSDTIPIIYNDIATNYTVKTDDNNTYYFSFDFIKDYIDQYIFFDEDEQKLTVTTEDKVIRMESDNLDYYVNDKPFYLDMPFLIFDGSPYIPLSVVEMLYPVSIDYNTATNLMVVTSTDVEYSTSTVLSKTKLKLSVDKPEITLKSFNLKKSDTVIVYTDLSTDNYYFVRTNEGYLGYISRKKLSKPVSVPSETTDNITDNTIKNKKNKITGKINLTFDQITNYSANISYATNFPDGVNVLCPTWFSFEPTENGTNCEIKNLADIDYVNFAHSNNAQLWALLTDNFDSSISHTVLSTSENRQKVIKQLLAFTSLYNLDGINIDFEAVPKTDGDYFVQFIRELAPLLREQGAVLSIDTFVPKPWTAHYNRKEISQSADYIIVMGYDEYTNGSSESGSVASLSWSELAITSTLAEEVPAEKLILGIPFYSRLWTEEYTSNGVNLSCKAYGMDSARSVMEDMMKDTDEKFTYLADVGQYYAEHTDGNTTYKLWLEDETSVRSRLALVKQYNIAGCGSWKRSLASDNIWNIIKTELSKN